MKARLGLILGLYVGLIGAAAARHRPPPLCSPPDAQRPVHFVVQGTQARMIGKIDATTPDTIRTLMARYPAVETLVLEALPGSDDNLVTFTVGRLVRGHGFKTHVPSYGVIASGGTDLFIAGVVRTIEPGAHIGVHSWSALDAQGRTIWGSRLPRTDHWHQVFVAYYQEMGMAAEFYWFAIQAASPHGVHWLTAAELQRFGLLSALAQVL